MYSIGGKELKNPMIENLICIKGEGGVKGSYAQTIIINKTKKERFMAKDKEAFSEKGSVRYPLISRITGVSARNSMILITRYAFLYFAILGIFDHSI